MGFWSGILDFNDGYSLDPKIKAIQQKAEQLKIYNMLKNIANHGDGSKDEENTVEWEGCILRYSHPSTSPSKGVNFIFGSGIGSPNTGGFYISNETTLIMGDGTILYSSEKRHFSSNTIEYIHAFRYGKWVGRLKVHSEKLSLDHQKYLISSMNEKNLNLFAEIDF